MNTFLKVVISLICLLVLMSCLSTKQDTDEQISTTEVDAENAQSSEVYLAPPNSEQYQAWADHGNNREGDKWTCVESEDGLVLEIDVNYGRGKTIEKRDESNRQGDYYDDWNNLVNVANQEELCGYSDWRAPTQDELGSVWGCTNGVCINTDIPPYTQTAEYSGYDSFTPNVNDNYSTGGVLLDFNFGNNDYSGTGGNKNSIRLVRRRE